MVLRLEEQLDRMRREVTRMAARVQELEADVAREMRRIADEVREIVPARDYRSLQELWNESRTKGAGGRPITLGPTE